MKRLKKMLTTLNSRVCFVDMAKGISGERLKKILTTPNWIVFSVVVASVGLLIAVLSNQWPELDSDRRYWINIYLKSIAGIFAFGFAWWRWDILRMKSNDETYLKAIETLTSSNNLKTSFVGSSYALLNLASNDPEKYAVPGVATLEAAIRELSEQSYSKWMDDLQNQSRNIKYGYAERKRLPAIIEMLRVILKIRKQWKGKPTLPDMNLGFADLRELKPEDIKDHKKAFNKANLQRSDLRSVEIPADSPLRDSKLENALINMKKNIDWGKKQFELKGHDNCLVNKKTLARYFLAGNWSGEIKAGNRTGEVDAGNQSDKVKIREFSKKSESYSRMFVNSRIGGGPGVNFDNMDLSGCDFRYAILIGASFLNTILEKANFLHANLENADFGSSKLIGASFHNTILKNANFLHANSENADFGSSKIEEAKNLLLKRNSDEI